MTPALINSELQLVILRALSIMTSHGGSHDRVQVADQAAGDIIRLALKTPLNDPIFSLCVTVLCHSGRHLFHTALNPFIETSIHLKRTAFMTQMQPKERLQRLGPSIRDP